MASEEWVHKRLINVEIFIPHKLSRSFQTKDGRTVYTCPHSENAITKRNIPIKQIVETFEEPELILPNKYWTNAQNYIKMFADKKLKIGVKDDGEPFVIITAFYWEEIK